MNIDLDNILNRLLKLEDDIKSVKIENSILQKKVNNNKKEFEYQQEYIYALEIDINRLNQYGHRQKLKFLVYQVQLGMKIWKMKFLRS